MMGANVGHLIRNPHHGLNRTMILDIWGKVHKKEREKKAGLYFALQTRLFVTHVHLSAELDEVLEC